MFERKGYLEVRTSGFHTAVECLRGSNTLCIGLQIELPTDGEDKVDEDSLMEIAVRCRNFFVLLAVALLSRL